MKPCVLILTTLLTHKSQILDYKVVSILCQLEQLSQPGPDCTLLAIFRGGAAQTLSRFVRESIKAYVYQRAEGAMKKENCLLNV